jgi:hypothetical protein
MNKFFVPNKVYEERLAICKECVYYFKKIKARIAPMECPQKYWQKTTEIETPDDLPQHLIEEVLDIWDDLKTGRAKNVETKKKMIELYNVIYMTNYGVGTNCGSCISTCYDGIKKLYKKYTE